MVALTLPPISPTPAAPAAAAGGGARWASADEMPEVMHAVRAAIEAGRTVRGRALQGAATAFKVFDADRSGSVDAAEFEAAVHRLDLGLGAGQTRELLALFDQDGSGRVEYNEFLTQLGRIPADAARPSASPPPAVFTGTLRIISARGLAAADSLGGGDEVDDSGAPDPYAEVYWDDELVGRTNVEQSTKEPRWAASRFPLSVELGAKPHTLRVELYDWDEGGVDRDFLGEVVLRGEGAHGLPNHSVEYPLTKKLAPSAGLPDANQPGGGHGGGWRGWEAAHAGGSGSVRNAHILASFNESVAGAFRALDAPPAPVHDWWSVLRWVRRHLGGPAGGQAYPRNVL
jgi:hypothetical protein